MPKKPGILQRLTVAQFKDVDQAAKQARLLGEEPVTLAEIFVRVHGLTATDREREELANEIARRAGRQDC